MMRNARAEISAVASLLISKAALIFDPAGGEYQLPATRRRSEISEVSLA
jgi:hypothetical protein